jgi:hypothetical protein
MGTVCKNRLASVPFVVTAETGIQRLDISFCGEVIQGEDGLSDRLAQLLNVQLFPCTFKDFESAIAFNALKQFQIHHLESKVAAMDYCGSLHRLTDNTFTASVPVGPALCVTGCSSDGLPEHVQKLPTLQPLVGGSYNEDTFRSGTRD